MNLNLNLIEFIEKLYFYHNQLFLLNHQYCNCLVHTFRNITKDRIKNEKNDVQLLK